MSGEIVAVAPTEAKRWPGGEENVGVAAAQAAQAAQLAHPIEPHDGAPMNARKLLRGHPVESIAITTDADVGRRYPPLLRIHPSTTGAISSRHLRPLKMP